MAEGAMAEGARESPPQGEGGLRVRVRFLLRGSGERDGLPPEEEGSACPVGRGKGKGVPAVLGSPKELGAWQHSQALKASRLHSHWVAEAWLPCESELCYAWVTVGTKNVESQSDVNPPRHLKIERCPCVVMADWGQEDHVVVADLVRVRVQTFHRAERGGRLAVGGSGPLGDWNPRKAIPAREDPPGSDCWKAELQVGRGVSEHWKWLELDEQERVLRWEERGERPLTADNSYLLLNAPWNEESRVLYVGEEEHERCRPHFLQDESTSTGDNPFIVPLPNSPADTCEGAPEAVDNGSKMPYCVELKLTGPSGCTTWRPLGSPARPNPPRRVHGAPVSGQMPSTSKGVHSEPQLSRPAPMTSHVRPSVPRTFEWSVSRTEGSQSMPALDIHIPRPNRNFGIGVKIALYRAGVKDFFASHTGGLSLILLGMLAMLYGHRTDAPLLVQNTGRDIQWRLLGIH